jgi:hypothetical protein
MIPNPHKVPAVKGPDTFLGRLAADVPTNQAPNMNALIDSNDTFTMNGRAIGVAGSTPAGAPAVDGRTA